MLSPEQSVLERFLTSVILSTSSAQLEGRTVRRCGELDGVHAAALAVSSPGPNVRVATSGVGGKAWDEMVASWKSARDLGDLRIDVTPTGQDKFQVIRVDVEASHVVLALCAPDGLAPSVLDDARMMAEIFLSWSARDMRGGEAPSMVTGTGIESSYLNLSSLVETLYHSMNGALAIIGMSASVVLQSQGHTQFGVETAHTVKAATDGLGRSLYALDEMLTVWTNGNSWCNPAVNVHLAIESLKRQAPAAHKGLRFDFDVAGPAHSVALGGATVAWLTRELLAIVLSRIGPTSSSTTDASQVFVSLDDSASSNSTRIAVYTPGSLGSGAASSEVEMRTRHLTHLSSRFGCHLELGDDRGQGVVSLVLPRKVR